MSVLIDYVHQELIQTPELPKFKAGDNITVFYKIKEGAKERIQQFRGDVMQIRGGDNNPNRTITVRKISGGIEVERIFPLLSPNIEQIKVNKFGKVRRARLFYLRGLMGKKARIKERRFVKKK
ncbi:MAG: 50S ribosomal protein L19 [Chitinophagales bacterium]